MVAEPARKEQGRPSPRPRERPPVTLQRDVLAGLARRLGISSGQLWTVAIVTVAAAILLAAVLPATLAGAHS